MATAPPLCLDPDPHLTRVVNHIARVTTPSVPNCLKRKAVALDPEDDEHEKLRRSKIMAFANSPRPKLHNPKYVLLRFMTLVF
jgi:transcription factor SPT20